MITKVSIKNLRGIKQGTLDELAQLSVLVGPNNSGKSTILEALLLLGGGHPKDIVERLVKRRGWAGIGCVSKLANSLEEEIALEASEDNQHIKVGVIFSRPQDESWVDLSVAGNKNGRIRVNHNGNVAQLEGDQTAVQSADRFVDLNVITGVPVIEDAYSDAIGSGKNKEAEIDQLVAEIDPEKPTLRILKSGGEYVLHKVGQEPVPVYFTGDGFKRLLFIACILAARARGLVLMEEPECFQHPTYVKKLASLIWGAIGQGTQVILSTHSMELLEFLFQAEGAPLEKAAVFHTRLKDGLLKASRIPGAQAAERLQRLGEDLRR